MILEKGSYINGLFLLLPSSIAVVFFHNTRPTMTTSIFLHKQTTT